MAYNWQLSDWPDFTYDLSEVEDVLFAFAEKVGHVTGVLKALPADAQTDAMLNFMVAEAIKTSEIEGEFLSRQDVLSSIRNKLGLNKHLEQVRDKKSAGAGELMVAVRNAYAAPLTGQMLFDWHKMLLNDAGNIQIGAWRTHEDPMQIVSGAMGNWKVHFEAPPSKEVAIEMNRFIQWFNDSAPGGKAEMRKAPVRTAIAHLYFESIHPFEDGNGRIGRAIAEKALSQTIGRPVMLSLSQTIEADKKAYYEALKKAQRGNEITDWIAYFVSLTLEAQNRAIELIDFTLKKTRFYDRYQKLLNPRQLKAVRKMMDAGPEGFIGGMNASKYTSVTGAPKATATRDLQALAELKAFIPKGGGRSTHYLLNLED
jgi:Fic family protein